LTEKFEDAMKATTAGGYLQTFFEASDPRISVCWFISGSDFLQSRGYPEGVSSNFSAEKPDPWK